MKSGGIEELGALLHAKPGAYALLLGAGVSRDAGIPTGNEIALAIARNLRGKSGKASTADPRHWYAGKFKEALTYSNIIKRLGKTKEEEISLLRSYIEPKPEEAKKGVKVPTPAHESIAGLVRHGYVRLILTTNFDHLIQDAIEEEGVAVRILNEPNRYSKPYLLHECTIAMLNGDYSTGNILNSEEELRSFKKRGSIKEFLRRVFREYGLIVCGWSGDSDPAITRLMEDEFKSTYSLFWVARGLQDGKPKLGKTAARITQKLSGRIIEAKAAKNFFGPLLDIALDYRDSTRPVRRSESMVATVKRHLSDRRRWIRLHDLFNDEIEYVNNARFAPGMDPAFKELQRDVFDHTLAYYEGHSERLVRMMAVLAYYPTPVPESLISKSIRRLMFVAPRPLNHTYGQLQYYPALLTTYAAGICALAGRNFRRLPHVFLQESYVDPKTCDRDDINISMVFSDRAAGLLWDPIMDDYSPVSRHLVEVLRDPLKSYFSSYGEYVEQLETFEYLMCLVSYIRHPSPNRAFKPYGLFLRHFTRRDPVFPVRDFYWDREDEFREGTAWRELKRWGLFQPQSPEFRPIHNDFRRSLEAYLASGVLGGH